MRRVASFSIVAFATIPFGCTESDRPAPSPVALVVREGRSAASLDEVLALDDERIDLGTAALRIDEWVEPQLDVEAAERALDRLAESLALDVAALADSGDVADAIIRLLHWRTIPGRALAYDWNASRLSELLTDGVGNCASMTMLYLAVADRAGIEMRGVLGHLHVFPRLIGAPSIDLEPTEQWRAEAGGRPDDFFFSETHRDGGDLGTELGRRDVLAVYAANAMSTLVQGGRLDRALELGSRLLTVAPESVAVHRAMANARLEEGRPRDAIEHLRVAIDRRPDDADMWFEIAQAHRAAAELAAAEHAVRKAIEIDRRFPPYWIELAEILIADGRPVDAADAARAATAVPVTQLHPVRRHELALTYGTRSAVLAKADAVRAHALTIRAGELLAVPLGAGAPEALRANVDEAAKLRLTSELLLLRSRINSTGVDEELRSRYASASAQLIARRELAQDESIAEIRRDVERALDASPPR